MAIIKIFEGQTVVDVEVSDEFAVIYAEIEHKEYLVNRKETRRHQSLDKSLDRGWDVWDRSVNIEDNLIQLEEKEQICNALKFLTEKQRLILIAYVLQNKSFREIGDELGLHKDTVREHYLSAIKKMKKLLQDTPSKPKSRGN